MSSELAAIAERPAAKRMIEKELEIRVDDGKAFQAATPEAMDRFFGRGKYAKAMAG